MFPQNWDLIIGDGFAQRTIIDPLVGSGSLYLQVSAENNVHLAVPESPLQHGLLGGRYRFSVNIKEGSGDTTPIYTGLCFMCSAKNITTGTQNFYYTGVRVNADVGDTHRLFLRKVTAGTIYNSGVAVTSAIVLEDTGYDVIYTVQILWRLSGSNLTLQLSTGREVDYSDLIEVFSGIDTTPFLMSTNESFFIRAEPGITSALSYIDNVEVSQII